MYICIYVYIHIYILIYMKGSVLTKTASSPRITRRKRLQFQRICTGLTARRGQRFGEYSSRTE